MSVIDRLNIIRESEGLNVSAFERKISKSTGYLNLMMKRQSDPGVDVLSEIIKEFPKINIEWLISGKGEMLKSTDNILREPAANYEEKKALNKQIEDLAYGINRRFDDVERALKVLMLDVSEVKLKADAVDTDKITKALDDLGVLKSKV